MSRASVPVLLIVALAALFVGEFVYSYPQLPAVVASHFNGQGVPDAWMPKEKFAGFMAVLFVILGLGTVGMVASMWYFPTATINLPNRQFWLAPDREKSTRQMLVRRGLWFWAATWLLLVWLMHGTLQVNLGRAQALDMIPALVFYLGFVAIWTVELIWRFARTGQEPVS